MSSIITGAHWIIYSADPQADKDFIKDILKFPYVDIGHGWLIFELPPAEIAIHPSTESGPQELYLMCDDIHLFVQEMSAQKISCSAIENQRWGFLVYLTLPGGGRIGVYEPKHTRPNAGVNKAD